MSQSRDRYGSGYRLDDEQRACVRDCLAKARIALSQRDFEQLTRNIEVSIDRFRRAEPESTFREAHDNLRELWKISHDDDPPVAVLRARIQALPRQRSHILTAARRSSFRGFSRRILPPPDFSNGPASPMGQSSSLRLGC
jgi:hypothetical protein